MNRESVMPSIPLIEVDETASVLAGALAAHRDAFGGRLGKPAEGPLFRTAPDGSIVDRGGTLVQAPTPQHTPKGA
jgi:hypothetical protein